MKSRILVFLTALLAVTQGWATVVPGDCSATGSGNSVSYSYDTDTKVLTISGTGAMKDYATSDGTPGRAPWLSKYSSVIKTVIIEYGVTHIGSNAFYQCSAITSVTIPSTVTTIGKSGLTYGGAFKGCTSLADVYLYTNPASLTYYGPNDFKSSKATTCHVPDSYYSTYTSSFSSMNVTFSKNGPTGLSDDPYLIGTLLAWNAFAEKVNNGIQPGTCAKLTAAISGVTTSVGTESHPYTGTFDGQGKNLTNVSISGSTNVGLFGYVNGGTIKNMVLKSGTVSATDVNVGGIVGNLYAGTVQYCANYATVSSSYSGMARCGGIVGHMYNIDDNDLTKTVTRCVNYGNVSAVNYAGGIVGSIGYGSITYCQNYGTISTSSTSSRICGGIVGYNTSTNTLTNNHNGGNVSRAQSGATSQLIQGSSTPNVDASNTYLHSMTLTVAGTSYTGDALSSYRAGATCVYDNPSGIAISGTTYSGPTPTYVNFTLSYTLNGGTVSSANPTTYNYGTTTFTLRNPTRTGYTFAGWTGTGLASASTTVTIAKGSTGKRSYTANWTENTYSVVFNKNASDAIGTMSNESFTYGTSKALTSNTFSRTGYRFAGWATSSSGSVVYSNGQSVSNLTSTNGGTVNLYAKWTRNEATLNQATDNSTFISTNNALVYDITQTRTLQAGGWNTFCVPFDISSSQITSVFGAGTRVRELDSSSYDEGTKALTLNFTEATSIEAGKPYLVYLGSGSNVANPTFNDVTIASGATTTETTYVDFVPVINRTQVTADVDNVLFLGAGNTLLHPSSEGQYMNGFRAYFLLTSGAAGVKSFQLNFGDETGIEGLSPAPSPVGEGGVYDLQGCRVKGRPAQKGLYIVNGKKVVVR